MEPSDITHTNEKNSNPSFKVKKKEILIKNFSQKKHGNIIIREGNPVVNILQYLQGDDHEQSEKLRK